MLRKQISEKEQKGSVKSYSTALAPSQLMGSPAFKRRNEASPSITVDPFVRVHEVMSQNRSRTQLETSEQSITAAARKER